MLQGGMVSLGWSVKDDRNLEVFVGFLMGSPRILTLATMIHDFSLNGKRVSLLKSNDFLWQKFLGRGSNNGWRESKLQSFTKTAGLYSLTASPAFPTCWRFWMSPTTQRLQVLGSGMSGPVQLATGQGGCLWMSVVKLHTEGAWNNSEPFVSFNWLHPSYDLSPRREKSGLRGVCHVFCQVFMYVLPAKYR